MNEAFLHEFEKQSRIRVRKRLEAEAARIRRSARESILYGLGGAAVVPAIKRLSTLIEHKGKPPVSDKFYHIGRRKIPTWLPAAAATGFIGAGVVPYLKDLIRVKRTQFAEQRLHKKSAAELLSPRVFKAPQIRGKIPAIIPERTKSMSGQMLGTAQRVGKMHAGEYRL